MPRGFDEMEQKQIIEKIKKVARELFSQAGVKKTSIKELTERVGIAQGSFYKFFESKELLYFVLLEEDELEIKQEVMSQFSNLEEMGPSQFANVIVYAVKHIQSYPLLYRLYSTDEYEYVVRKLPKEVLDTHGQEDTISLTPLLQHLQQAGKVQMSINFDVVSGALRALFLLPLHKKEIGEAVYMDTLLFMAEAIAYNIFKEASDD
ncbi:TetR/AcrR family transcriptional regulator [Alkalihalobacillus sp. LMS39]|uniref:TetR/AcrR family transcriptional regulator n=1 Tax=Alkalihalobacillus sp. LMS39 TaxID=2924032 RepID=UPI001FB4DE21|nr:TetR/AcrR family transcriptional regulator [Alkalihalobacillus sp. LMS39]UOE92132.1 TetR/AcrR family transcriptional regulator [Alkalihalobacillus sp. LMS39]